MKDIVDGLFECDRSRPFLTLQREESALHKHRNHVGRLDMVLQRRVPPNDVELRIAQRT